MNKKMPLEQSEVAKRTSKEAACTSIEILYAHADAVEDCESSSSQSELSNQLSQCLAQENIKSLLASNRIIISHSIDKTAIRITSANNDLAEIAQQIQPVILYDHSSISIDMGNQYIEIKLSRESLLKDMFMTILKIKNTNSGTSPAL